MTDEFDDKINRDYVKQQSSYATEDDLDETLDKEEKIEDKLLNSDVLEKYTRIGRLMFDMLKDYKKGLYREVPWFTIGSIVFSLLYVLNPFDLVPDFIPGLGYIDDLTVLSFAVRFIETDLHNYLDWRDAPKDDENPDPAQ